MQVVIDAIPLAVFLVVGFLSTAFGLGEMSMYANPRKRHLSRATPVSFIGGMLLFAVGIASFVIVAIAAYERGCQ